MTTLGHYWIELMDLTCVINVRNGERYLEGALLSILNGNGAVEVILVDNQSTDGTQAIASKFSDLTYVQTPKFLSLGAARNYSLQFVNSSYMTWLDADDQWMPDFHKSYTVAANRFPEAVMISAGSVIVDSWGRLLPVRRQRFLSQETDGEIVDGDSLERLMERIGMIDAWCSYVFKTSAIKAVGGLDLRFDFAEDLDLIGRLLTMGSGIHVQSNLTKLRYHPDQLTRKLSPYKRSSEIVQSLENAATTSGRAFESQLLTAKAVLNFKSAVQVAIANRFDLKALVLLSCAAANVRVWKWFSHPQYLSFVCRQLGIARAYRSEQLRLLEIRLADKREVAPQI